MFSNWFPPCPVPSPRFCSPLFIHFAYMFSVSALALLYFSLLPFFVSFPNPIWPWYTNSSVCSSLCTLVTSLSQTYLSYSHPCIIVGRLHLSRTHRRLSSHARSRESSSCLSSSLLNLGRHTRDFPSRNIAPTRPSQRDANAKGVT